MSYGDTDILGFRYAGFWLRLIAGFIDAGILVLVMFVFAMLFGIDLASEAPSDAELSSIATVELGGILVGWLYYAFMESTGAQGTIGKALMGIYVTDMEGGRINFLQGSVRYWAKLISLALLFTGFLMIGFTRYKQGLHDKIAGCLVQKR